VGKTTRNSKQSLPNSTINRANAFILYFLPIISSHILFAASHSNSRQKARKTTATNQKLQKLNTKTTPEVLIFQNPHHRPKTQSIPTNQYESKTQSQI
jgi:hypothetical protein